MSSEHLTVEAYSRADSLAYGMLVDVSEPARVVGFKVPVAISRAAWCQAVEWTAADSFRQQGYQEQSARLWDALTLCVDQARRTDADKLTFRVCCLPRSGLRVPVWMTLKAVIDGDGEGQLFITIMLTDEA